MKNEEEEEIDTLNDCWGWVITVGSLIPINLSSAHKCFPFVKERFLLFPPTTVPKTPSTPSLPPIHLSVLTVSPRSYVLGGR